MSVSLTCTQVGALLSFYIDNKLSDELKAFVDAHLSICPTCRLKLETLKTMLKNLRDAQNELSCVKIESEKSAQDSQQDSQYNEFKVSLSAYIDNELEDSENIRVKKYIISNPNARQEIESMYNLKKLLHNSFERTKNECKEDYSKLIFRRIDIKEEVYAPDSFAKVVAIFAFIFVVFTFTAIVLLWI